MIGPYLGKLDINSFNDEAQTAVRWTQSVLRDDVRTYMESLPTTLSKTPFTLVHASPRQPVWEYILMRTRPPSILVILIRPIVWSATPMCPAHLNRKIIKYVPHQPDYNQPSNSPETPPHHQSRQCRPAARFRSTRRLCLVRPGNDDLGISACRLSHRRNAGTNARNRYAQTS